MEPPWQTAGYVIPALKDSRRRTLELVSDLSDEQLRVPLLPIINPIVWEMGHVGWFQERWALRHVRGDAPLLEYADSLWDSSAVAHDTRWDLPLPSRAGTLGYVLKNEETSQIRAAIKAVAAGQDWISPRLAYIFATDDAPDRPGLSPQETRALRLYATGMAMKSVAKRMAISEETAKQYVGRVREKYARAGRAAPTKLDLYYRAVEDGHLPPLP